MLLDGLKIKLVTLSVGTAKSPLVLKLNVLVFWINKYRIMG